MKYGFEKGKKYGGPGAGHCAVRSGGGIPAELLLGPVFGRRENAVFSRSGRQGPEWPGEKE